MKTITLNLSQYDAQWISNILEDKFDFMENFTCSMDPSEDDIDELEHDLQKLKTIIEQLRAK